MRAHGIQVATVQSPLTVRPFQVRYMIDSFATFEHQFNMYICEEIFGNCK